MVDILSSVLSGSFIGGHNLKTGDRGQYINVGHFCLALNPAAFREEGEFEEELDDLIDMLHGTEPVDPAQPVLVAGDPEHRERLIRLENGIPMTETLFNEVRQVAEACGAPFILGNDAS
jgi:LDH2 family malate/lactate/ureidoglycolate dehydrogenase